MFIASGILDPISVYANSFFVFHNYVMFFLILVIIFIIWLLKLAIRFFIVDRLVFEFYTNLFYPTPLFFNINLSVNNYFLPIKKRIWKIIVISYLLFCVFIMVYLRYVFWRQIGRFILIILAVVDYFFSSWWRLYTRLYIYLLKWSFTQWILSLIDYSKEWIFSSYTLLFGIFGEIRYLCTLESLSSFELPILKKNGNIYDLNLIYRFFLFQNSFNLLKFISWYTIIFNSQLKQTNNLENFENFFNKIQSMSNKYIKPIIYNSNLWSHTNFFILNFFFVRSSYLFGPVFHLQYFNFLAYKIYSIRLTEKFINLNGLNYNDKRLENSIFWVDVLNTKNGFYSSEPLFSKQFRWNLFLQNQQRLLSTHQNSILRELFPNRLNILKKNVMIDEKRVFFIEKFYNSIRDSLTIFNQIVLNKKAFSVILRAYSFLKHGLLPLNTKNFLNSTTSKRWFLRINTEGWQDEWEVAFAEYNELNTIFARLKKAFWTGYLTEFVFFPNSDLVILKIRVEKFVSRVEDFVLFDFLWYFNNYFENKLKIDLMELKPYFGRFTLNKFSRLKKKRDLMEFDLLRGLNFFYSNEFLNLTYSIVKLSSKQLVIKAVSSCLQSKTLYCYSWLELNEKLFFIKHISDISECYSIIFRSGTTVLFSKVSPAFFDEWALLQPKDFFYNLNILLTSSFLFHSIIQRTLQAEIKVLQSFPLYYIQIHDSVVFWNYFLARYRFFEYLFKFNLSISNSEGFSFFGVTDSMKEILLQNREEIFFSNSLIPNEKSVNSFNFYSLNLSVPILYFDVLIQGHNALVFDDSFILKNLFFTKSLLTNSRFWDDHDSPSYFTNARAIKCNLFTPFKWLKRDETDFYSKSYFNHFDRKSLMNVISLKSMAVYRNLFFLDNFKRFFEFYFRDSSALFYLLFMHFRHKTSLEWFWTIVPALILALIAIPSLCLLYLSDRPISKNTFSVLFKAVAHQWYWDYTVYSNSYRWFQEFIVSGSSFNKSYAFDSYLINEDNLEDGRYRLLEADNRLVLPSGSLVRGIITSADVLHSWALPSAVVKVDAVPGRLNQVLFIIPTTGVFYGQCSELCGVNHGFMPIAVEVIPFELFFIRS